jgi:hypothetical protein
MVYGIFRDGENYKIKKGIVLGETEKEIRVEYDAFEWSYRKEEIGFLVFGSLESASEAVEGMQKIARAGRGRE